MVKISNWKDRTMKIAGGDVRFSSENHAEQLDLTLENTAQKRIFRQRSGTQRINPEAPRVIVDRVSLSQKQTTAFQSGYGAKITGKSMVTSPRDGEAVLHEQTQVVEKLVGGIIDKEAVMRKMTAGRDVVLDGVDVPPEGPSDPAGRSSLPSFATVSSVREISLKRTDIHFESEMAAFSARGSVTTMDGRSIDFSLDLSLDRTFLSRTEEEILVQQWQERVDLTDPLVISLDGRMPELTDAVFAFDLNADGSKEDVSFASAGAGFLAFDKNGDKVINDGTELFGPRTGNGFKELQAFDKDQNGWIDENDAVFSQLVVWTKDETGSDRLVTLKEAGIGAIGLGHAATLMDVAAMDNTLKGRLRSTGMFLFETGEVGTVHQVDLAERKIQGAGPAQAPAPALADSQGATAAEQGRGWEQPQLFQAPPSESVNPLQDLQERIKALKEEMKHLLENTGVVRGPVREIRYRKIHT